MSITWLKETIYIYTHTHSHTYAHVLLFACSIMSEYLLSHGLQHARFPCPSSSPGACLNSCPLSQWWHPTTSSSVAPVSSCLQSFQAYYSDRKKEINVIWSNMDRSRDYHTKWSKSDRERKYYMISYRWIKKRITVNSFTKQE